MRRALPLLVLVLAALAPGVVPVGPAHAQLSGRSVYFAEGTTRSGFFESISFLNTNPSRIVITLEYQFADGAPAVSRQVDVDPRTPAFVVPSEDTGVGT